MLRNVISQWALGIAALASAGCQLLVNTGGTPAPTSLPGALSEPGQIMTAPSGSPKTTSAPTSSGISGDIVDGEGKTRSHARVRVYPASPGKALPAIEIQSDEEGHFAAPTLPEGAYNIEVVATEDFKAFKQGVLVRNGAATTLDNVIVEATGTISGRVVSASLPDVTNLEGVDVFIPGSSFVAKSGASGAFLLSGVAVGSYTLVASKSGLGRDEETGVVVRARATTAVDRLLLTIQAPALSALRPTVAGPGARIELTGSNLGASAGELIEVFIEGIKASSVERKDDQAAEITLPRDARTGAVSVSVGGIKSNALPISVLSTFSVFPDDAELVVGSSIKYDVSAKDTEGASIVSESVPWVVTPSGIVEAASPQLKAIQTGQATLSVGSGTVTKHFAVTVIRGPGHVVERVVGIPGNDGEQYDGPVQNAKFQAIWSIASMLDGTVYSGGEDGIRRIVGGQVNSLAAGGGWIVRTKADMFDPHPAIPLRGSGTGLCFDSSGNLLVTSSNDNAIYSVSTAGTVQTLVQSPINQALKDGPSGEARFQGPMGIVVDSAGNIVFSEGHGLRKLAPDGYLSTIAGGNEHGFVDGNKASSRLSPSLYGLAIAPDGSFIFSDTLNNAIRRVTPDGHVSTIAGDGRPGYRYGVGKLAQFWVPRSIAIDKRGNIYVADTKNRRIRKIDSATHEVTTIVGGGNHTTLSPAFPGTSLSILNPFAVGIVGDNLYFSDEYGMSRISIQ